MKTMRKIVAVAVALVMAFSALCWSASAATPQADDGVVLDLVFIIDTTGSMDDDIAQVKSTMRDHLAQLESSGMDYRVAVIDYRDFASRTGYSGDYPYSVKCDFTRDSSKIISAINNLNLGDGGDWEETVYSAIIDGLDKLSWRSDSKKVAIIMGDAPALNPEPITGYTYQMAIEKLKYGETDLIEGDYRYSLDAANRSKVTLFAIATSSSPDVVESFDTLAEATGGKTYTASESVEISEIITEIIDEIPEVVDDSFSFFTFLLNLIFSIIDFVIGILA